MVSFLLFTFEKDFWAGESILQESQQHTLEKITEFFSFIYLKREFSRYTDKRGEDFSQFIHLKNAFFSVQVKEW